VRPLESHRLRTYSLSFTRYLVERCSLLHTVYLPYTCTFTNDKDDRKSIPVHIFQLAMNTISWPSRKQKCVSTSTVEAEYISTTLAVRQQLWLPCALKELGFTSIPSALSTDGEGAVDLTQNPRISDRRKHIDMAYDHIHELVETKIVVCGGLGRSMVSQNGRGLWCVLLLTRYVAGFDVLDDSMGKVEGCIPMPRCESHRALWTRQDSGPYEAELLLAKYGRMGTKLRTILRCLPMQQDCKAQDIWQVGTTRNSITTLGTDLYGFYYRCP